MTAAAKPSWLLYVVVRICEYATSHRDASAFGTLGPRCSEQMKFIAIWETEFRTNQNHYHGPVQVQNFGSPAIFCGSESSLLFGGVLSPEVLRGLGRVLAVRSWRRAGRVSGEQSVKVVGLFASPGGVLKS